MALASTATLHPSDTMGDAVSRRDPGPHEVARAGLILCYHSQPWHPYFLHDWPAGPLLVRMDQHRPSVGVQMASLLFRSII